LTEEEIFAQRAELYARREELAVASQVRCLSARLGRREWLFQETEIRLVLPQLKITPLPPGARWAGWPCSGLICHSRAPLPLLCWSLLTRQRELASGQPYAVLLLRHLPVGLRLPAPLEIAEGGLQELELDEHPWSAGRLPQGALLADLDRLAEGPV
jgi:hypothetical protein